jgi:hypothetical protein
VCLVCVCVCSLVGPVGAIGAVPSFGSARSVVQNGAIGSGGPLRGVGPRPHSTPNSHLTVGGLALFIAISMGMGAMSNGNGH